MSKPKSIHDVAEMVGIPRSDSEQILKEVRTNIATLDACARHNFSVPVDRHTKQPIPNATFACKWKCSKCGGVVDGSARNWYNLGLEHAQKGETKYGPQ